MSKLFKLTLVSLLVLFLVVFIYSVREYSEARDNLMDTEVSGENYTYLLDRLKYEQGSESGKDFVKKVKFAYKDKSISLKEYKKLMGEEGKLDILKNEQQKERHSRERAEFEQILSNN